MLWLMYPATRRVADYITETPPVSTDVATNSPTSRNDLRRRQPAAGLRGLGAVVFCSTTTSRSKSSMSSKPL